jgi:hypothetical protein
MGQIAKELLPERVVAHVLDERPAICISMCLAQLFFCGSGESGKQQRSYGIVPSEIDELFVGENRIGCAVNRKNDYYEKDGDSATVCEFQSFPCRQAAKFRGTELQRDGPGCTCPQYNRTV